MSNFTGSLLFSRYLRRIRHYRPQSPSSSTFFLVWHLWNCSTLVQIISVLKVILCQSLQPHLTTYPTLLWSPSRLRPGSAPLYSIHHTVKSSNRVLFCRPPPLYERYPTLHIILPGLLFHLNRPPTLGCKPNLSMDVIQPTLPQPFQNRIYHNRPTCPNQENPRPFHTIVQ